MARLWERIRTGQAAWEADYRRFARMRGFRSFNDASYHWRSFVACWAQPGFHRFWQVWNPGIAYFVYLLFIRLGGRRRWIAPTLVSFFACGLAHTVIVAPFFGRWSYSVIVAFMCFGSLTVLSRLLARYLRQERWPAVINTAINVGLVLASFDVGFRVDRIL